MKLPQPAHGGKLSKQDEEVFAQAKELASLRLEQCIADRQIFRAFDHGQAIRDVATKQATSVLEGSAVFESDPSWR
jgi:hypothetical protein